MVNVNFGKQDMTEADATAFYGEWVDKGIDNLIIDEPEKYPDLTWIVNIDYDADGVDYSAPPIIKVIKDGQEVFPINEEEMSWVTIT